MTRRRPKKGPARPREIRTHAERVTDPGINLEAMSLPANEDVSHEAETRTRTARVRRIDVFALFLERHAISDPDYMAVRRFETDLHLAAGVANTGDVDRIGGGGCAERVTQRMIDAEGRVTAVIRLMPQHYAKLIVSFLSPSHPMSALTRWRGEVERITGYADAKRQGDVIRWLAAAVAAAYREIDYPEPGRATA